MMIGPILKRKIEQDLKAHLSILGCEFLSNFRIDLDNMIAESEILRRNKDGWCSEFSSVNIYDSNNRIICSGNISFVITDSQNALFWWEHLSLKDERSWKEICFYEYEFPLHIWSQLSDAEKNRFKSINNQPAHASTNVFEEDLMSFLQKNQPQMH